MENGQSSENKKTKYILTKRWKQIYIPILSSLGLLFIISIIIICVTASNQAKSMTPGQKDPETGWAFHIVAPFVDLSSWVPLTNSYSINGVPNMAKVEQQTGISYYNLGFIQPDQTKPLDESGNIRWGWGGYYSLSESGNDGYQYPNIKQTINDLKNLGAGITISIGGQLGDAPWIVTNDVDKLASFYKDVIQTYDVKRLDLDIEESNQVQSGNIANAKAIKKVQDETGIDIVLTIPIMPNGWQDKQINIIKAYLDQGVQISLINSMTMCYGGGLYAGEDYGDASIRAIENSVQQMKNIWASYGTVLTDKQAYAKTGATVDIGYESSQYPVFTLEMTRKVVDHAKENGYGMLSYWSINRDAQMQPNNAINTLFSYLNVMNEFYA